MCKVEDSIEAVNRAADKLAEVCRSLCPDVLGLALQNHYNKVLQEEVPQDLLALVDKLQ